MPPAETGWALGSSSCGARNRFPAELLGEGLGRRRISLSAFQLLLSAARRMAAALSLASCSRADALLWVCGTRTTGHDPAAAEVDLRTAALKASSLTSFRFVRMLKYAPNASRALAAT
ncbi:hypothetical protein FQA47_021800 [Oryzias melastigma]|uniref:Uncharacterized protein n=1 Tax=Oryzias melastigma TaxID=30732 RepID=A0A834FS77_ORYME|nr:hypothetical protein FQA47_021800 [Oryzias melastigma]